MNNELEFKSVFLLLEVTELASFTVQQQKPWTGKQVNLRKIIFMLLHGLYILVAAGLS